MGAIPNCLHEQQAGSCDRSRQPAPIWDVRAADRSSAYNATVLVSSIQFLLKNTDCNLNLSSNACGIKQRNRKRNNPINNIYKLQYPTCNNRSPKHAQNDPENVGLDHHNQLVLSKSMSLKNIHTQFFASPHKVASEKIPYPRPKEKNTIKDVSLIVKTTETIRK